MIKWFGMLLGWILLDLLWWRGADRRIRSFKYARAWRGMLAIFMASQLAYLAVLFVGSIFEHVPDIKPIYWPVCAYIWHLFLLPGSILAYLIEKGIGAVRKAVRCTDPELADKTSVSSGRLTRRQALSAIGVALPPLITAGIAVPGTLGLGRFRVREVTLKLPTLPADLDGLTIAQVTDLHIGRFLPAGTMERVADATNAMGADLVIFTGDLLDGTCEKQAPGLEFLRRLDPRAGLAMVEGNHDVMHGADWFEKEFRDAGWPLLLDENKLFKVPGRQTPVQMLGIAWGELKLGSEIGQWGKGANMMHRHPTDEAMAASVQHVAAQRIDGAFPILLAHHPHALDPAAQAGLPLVLSGHTHGGQIMLTKNIGAGPLRFKYWAGEYEKGPTKLFVNNGVGNWFPLRVNAPSEIVKLILRRV
jgi:predicted MPP superfamily phosphohydrolase